MILTKSNFQPLKFFISRSMLLFLVTCMFVGGINSAFGASQTDKRKLAVQRQNLREVCAKAASNNNFNEADQAAAVMALEGFIHTDMSSSRVLKQDEPKYRAYLKSFPKDWADWAVIRRYDIISACPDSNGWYWVTVKVDLAAVWVLLAPVNPRLTLSDTEYILVDGQSENPLNHPITTEEFHLIDNQKLRLVIPSQTTRFKEFLVASEGAGSTRKWIVLNGETSQQWRPVRTNPAFLKSLEQKAQFLEKQPEAKACPQHSDDNYCNDFIEIIKDTRRYIKALKSIN